MRLNLKPLWVYLYKVVLFSFRFNIKSKLSKHITKFYVFLVRFTIALGSKYPATFLLDQLDLLAYNPLFNFVFALCSVVLLANVKGNNVSKVMIVLVGLLGIPVPYLVPYVNCYFSHFLIDYFLKPLPILLVFVL